MTRPGDVQATIDATYRDCSGGTVRLDPNENYALSEVRIPPYVTLDLNSARVTPERDAPLFYVAPGGRVENGYVDVRSSGVPEYDATLVDCGDAYWNPGGDGADTLKPSSAPLHRAIREPNGRVNRWVCRGPARNLFLYGPRSETGSTGLRLASTTGSRVGFQSVSDLYVFGFETGVRLQCDGDGFVNGNTFSRVQLHAQTGAAISLTGTSSTVNANNFTNVQIQPSLAYGADTVRTAGGVFVGTGESNCFTGHIWDPQKFESWSMKLGGSDERNAGAGDCNVFVTNEKSLSGLRSKLRDERGTKHSGIVGHASANRL